MMKLPVYGAGVVGGYLIHALCTVGHDMSILVRGRGEEKLERNGLVIHHYIQRKTTHDHPRVIEGLDFSKYYDAVFVVMQYQQMRGMLDDLARADSPVVVLVGNNFSAMKMEECIKTHTAVPRAVVFGFQGVGGRRENSESVCVWVGAGGLGYGFLNSLPDPKTRELLDYVFQSSKYKLLYQPGMQTWYQCHLVLILPVCYLCCALNCGLTKASRVQPRQTVDAAREGYRLLRGQVIPTLPQGDDQYFEPGPKRVVMFALLQVMTRTVLGHLAASDYCRSVVTETHALDDGLVQACGRTPNFPTPQWNSLRAQIPDWDTL